MIRHRPWEAPPHDFSIGLRPIEAERWFEGGQSEAARKRTLLAEGEDVWAQTEGSREAQMEGLALVEAATGRAAGAEEAPLWAASLLVADDLCLMQRRDGWTLTALSLCSGTYFTASEAIGKPLSILHAPVPGFGERFLTRVERIFDALSSDVVLERRNWTITASGDAHLPGSATIHAAAAKIPPEAAGERLFLRVERQTLRRLPETGAVLFTIRAWRNRLSDLKADPEALSGFQRAWRGAEANFRAYKGLARYDALVEAFFAHG